MRILLVDDDTSVLQALLAVLKTLSGHEIRVAANGEKALENAHAMGGVDVLITDVVMEPMDGFTLRDQVRAHYPSVRTVLITGYDLSDYAEQTVGCQLLQKPVSPETFLAAVARELRPPAPVAVIASRVGATARAVAVSEPRVFASSVSTVTAHAGAGDEGGMRLVGDSEPSLEGSISSAQADVSPAPEVNAINGEAPSHAPADENGAQSSAGLLGYIIGGYQIVSQLGEGRWGTVYAAVQTSINRPVGLRVLDPEKARSGNYKQHFIQDARAKASVQHPSILAVYEAGSADGWIFYTHEFVDGQHLQEIASSGRTVDEPTVLKILRVIGDGFLYLSRMNIPHALPEAGDIYLSYDGNPRLANLATSQGAPPTAEEGIRTLGAIVQLVISAESASPGLQALVRRMIQGGVSGMTGWGAVIQGVTALEPKIVPLEAAKISAQDRAAIAAVEAARRQQKRAFYINVASIISLVLLSGLLVWWKFVRSNERRLDQTVKIAAGEFLFAEGTPMTLEEFDIDKFEVTIGQYANFVKFIETHPEREKDFDHPEQPRWITGHVPEDWAIYWGRARKGVEVHGVPTSLNSPMMMVSWWDAYAYAKWRGRELPSELQWEKAARGTAGFKFPWGEQLDEKKLNSGADHNKLQPAEKGKVDGFNYWGEVDQQDDDESPAGVIGMAGNVSEWTSTWSAEQKPIVKGGHFAIPPQPMSAKITGHDAKDRQEFIGFRTVNRKLPSN